jgi:hypothetical protein
LPKYETRIKTTFGELIVHFDTIDQFREGLGSLDTDALSSTVNDRLGNLIVLEPRKAKPGAEFAYRFTPQGKVELVKVPSSAPMSIGLVLFAYDPEPVSAEEVFRAAGAKPVSYISQIDYRKFFDKTPEGKLLLTHPGRLWVQNEVLPKLRAANQ